LQQYPIRRIRLCRSPLKANASNQCHDKPRGQLSRDEMRAAKRAGMGRSQTDRVDRGGFSSLSNGIIRLHRSRERCGQRMRRHGGAVSSGCGAGVGGRTCHAHAASNISCARARPDPTASTPECPRSCAGTSQRLWRTGRKVSRRRGKERAKGRRPHERRQYGRCKIW